MIISTEQPCDDSSLPSRRLFQRFPLCPCRIKTLGPSARPLDEPCAELLAVTRLEAETLELPIADFRRALVGPRPMTTREPIGDRQQSSAARRQRATP